MRLPLCEHVERRARWLLTLVHELLAVAEKPLSALIEERLDPAIGAYLDFELAQKSPVLGVSQLDLNLLALSHKTSFGRLVGTAPSPLREWAAQFPCSGAEAL
jgi:hypothetical protein